MYNLYKSTDNDISTCLCYAFLKYITVNKLEVLMLVHLFLQLCRMQVQGVLKIINVQVSLIILNTVTVKLIHF